MPNIINKLEVENSSGITTCDIGAKSENISYGGSNVKSVLDGILNDNNKIDSGDVDLSGYYPTVQEAFTELLTAEGNVNSDKVDVNVSAEDIYATAGHYQDNSIDGFFENYTNDSTGYVFAKNVDVYDEESSTYTNLQTYLENIKVDVDASDIYATSGYYSDNDSLDGFLTKATDSSTGYIEANYIRSESGYQHNNPVSSFFENYTHDATGYVLAKNVDVYDEDVSGYYINLQDYLGGISVDVDITDIHATSGYYHDNDSIDGFFTKYTDSTTGYVKANSVLVTGYNEQPVDDVQSIFENILDDNKEHVKASSVIASSGYYHDNGTDNFFTQAIDDHGYIEASYIRTDSGYYSDISYSLNNFFEKTIDDTTGYVKADGVSLNSSSDTVQDVFDHILLDNSYDVDASKVVIPDNYGYQYADKNLTQVAERAIDKEGYIDDSHTKVNGGAYDGDTYSAAINALADRITALGG